MLLKRLHRLLQQRQQRGALFALLLRHHVQRMPEQRLNAKLLRQRVLDRVLGRFYDELDEGGALLADTLGHGRDDQKLEKLVLELYGKIQSHAWPLAWLRENRDRWAAMTAEGDFAATPYADILKEKIRRRAALWARRLRDRGERMRGHEQLETKHLPAFLNVAEQLERLAEREDWTEDDWRRELRETLAHELTHHMESRAGTHALDDKDAQELEAFRREFGEE